MPQSPFPGTEFPAISHCINPGKIYQFYEINQPIYNLSAMRISFLLAGSFLGCLLAGCHTKTTRIFDVHLHGSKDPALQMQTLHKAGVYKIALSTSWDLQHSYRLQPATEMLYGLLFPCPGGKVPYSLQPCFANGAAWPDTNWVEQQINERQIDFMGEVLSQYYGISPADTLLFPYYRLADKYSLPIGIHTGGAGPDHGCPDFSPEMGNPALLLPVLKQFPRLKIWIMHAGDQYYKEAIAIMQEHRQVYADISVISNPDIVPADRFSLIMQAFMDAGLEEQLLFGSDNGDIEKAIRAIDTLDFIPSAIKEKIYYQNAERFFRR